MFQALARDGWGLVVGFLTVLFTPFGRARRRAFWLGMLLLVLGFLALYRLPQEIRVWGWLLAWPWLCLTVTRLHDKGRSGFWVLVPIVINVLLVVLAIGGFLLFFSQGGSAVNSTYDGSINVAGGLASASSVAVLLIYNLIHLLMTGLGRGTPGPNRFGPAPGAPRMEAAAAPAAAPLP